MKFKILRELSFIFADTLIQEEFFTFNAICHHISRIYFSIEALKLKTIRRIIKINKTFVVNYR